MRLIKCFQKNSAWYKSAVTGSTPVGILWHDTGAGNPTIRRYVQPHETDANYAEMIKLLGKNAYGNDWNHKYTEIGLNGWIGKLADGSVASIQAGPWDMVPWGCGGGSYGSLNGKLNGSYVGKHWLQFEICDDGYSNKSYFETAYKEAVELSAYWCIRFNIDPNGTINFGGIKVPTIVCHSDSHSLGFGSNHGDVYLWFGKQGLSKNMKKVRADITAKITEMRKTMIIGTVSPAKLTIRAGAGTDYADIDYYYANDVVVITEKKSVNSDVWGKTPEGWVNMKYINTDNTIATPVVPEVPEIADSAAVSFYVGDLVAIKSGATYSTGKQVPDWVRNLKWYVDAVDGNRIIINKSEDGKYAIKSPIEAKYLTLIKSAKPVEKPATLQDGDRITLTTTKYSNGKDIPDWVLNSVLYYRGEASKTEAKFSVLKTGDITGKVLKDNIKAYEASTTPPAVVTPPVEPTEPPTNQEEQKPVEIPDSEKDPVYTIRRPIIGQVSKFTDYRKMVDFIKQNNLDFDENIARAFYEIAPIYNIDPSHAICQSILETGWFKFKGSSVSPEQHNYCGLGATGGGVAGAKFDTIEAGVEAQCQHLFAYGCKEPLPANRTLYDPRFKLVTRGIATIWEELAGRWAAAYTDKKYSSIYEASLHEATYGQLILALQKQFEAFEWTAPVEPETPPEVEIELPSEPNEAEPSVSQPEQPPVVENQDNNLGAENSNTNNEAQDEQTANVFVQIINLIKLILETIKKFINKE